MKRATLLLLVLGLLSAIKCAKKVKTTARPTDPPPERAPDDQEQSQPAVSNQDAPKRATARPVFRPKEQLPEEQQEQQQSKPANKPKNPPPDETTTLSPELKKQPPPDQQQKETPNDSQELLDQRLRKSFFDLYKQQMQIKLQFVVKPLNRSLDKLRLHRSITDGQPNQRSKLDWIKAAEVVIGALNSGPFKNGSISELEKSAHLLDCAEKYSTNEMKTLDFSQGIRYKFGEQNPEPWIRAADERIARIVRLVNDLVHLADNE